MPGTRFDHVADDYDAGRPSYPDKFFAAIEEITGPLAGRLVLDGGAGTGIASRQLSARGGRVAGYDIAERMLRRARARSPELSFVLADGSMLPFRDGCADLACFAQSWHWLDQERASRELARVLRPGGHWAAWWNHAAADGEEWFAAYQDAKESACPPLPPVSGHYGLEPGGNRAERALRAWRQHPGAVDQDGGRAGLDHRRAQQVLRQRDPAG
jgi:ubiquinone/menaquinone biosynthesis C-methylase UbiE